MPATSYHPIIYVRGFAATQGEIEETVADPYMGFNIGSTKARMAWTGDVKRFYFESPLVRLMSDHDYDDVFVDGDDLVAAERPDCVIPYRSIIIYRYYDEASKDFGTGETPPIEHFAKGLDKLILRLRDKICANPNNAVTPEDFRVHLVAHSMGGLVCRAFLQNTKLGSAEARGAVDKLFTYATPHNGIDMRIVRNVPGWLSFGDVNNFNRERMAEYLGLPKGDDVSIVKNFPPERIFNLVGTNPRDYSRGRRPLGLGGGRRERRAGAHRERHHARAGPRRQGREFAARLRAPQPLGPLRHRELRGGLPEPHALPVRRRCAWTASSTSTTSRCRWRCRRSSRPAKTVHASYQFEIAVSVRGCQWQMTRREVRENSAIFRSYDDLFPGRRRDPAPTRSRQEPAPVLRVPRPEQERQGLRLGVSFAFDLKVLVPDYEVDGVLFMKRHYEGGYILRELILVEAFPDDAALGGWRIKYGYQDDNPGKPGVDAVTRALDGEAGIAFDIPIAQKTRPGRDRARCALRRGFGPSTLFLACAAHLDLPSVTAIEWKSIKRPEATLARVQWGARRQRSPGSARLDRA